MVVIHRQIDRERIASIIIFLCLLIIFLTMLTIRLLDVKVLNIEIVDKGLYTIVTDNGPINIDKNDILRIERTYVKTSITGTPVELDRIYTTKGFVYFSSLDSFYKVGHQLINTVDSKEKPVWISLTNNDANQVDKISSQLKNANFLLVQRYRYAIGTSSKYTSVILNVISLQYFVLVVGGIALSFLIFPLRLETPMAARPFIQHEQDCTDEEKFGVIAK